MKGSVAGVGSSPSFPCKHVAGSEGETDPDLNLSHPVDSWEIGPYSFNIRAVAVGLSRTSYVLDAAAHFSLINTFIPQPLKIPLHMCSAWIRLYIVHSILFLHAANTPRRQICSVISLKSLSLDLRFYSFVSGIDTSHSTGSLWVTRLF